ncbi:TetR/AcrR family transcriptional regulator [Actinomadura sp. WMMB 499]|uniref:TetR/AcrR family transcriptional regulator n=1 Tax=Actinomadura sp. WMMB 499 TaxID=1219491 RepID=UPI001244E106|nr:TetR/AcrR family transcriptional regulator [Actinomadura sp. WMMB 499]QFG20292.1 TetR/AcrR family transcriptional regulator [Actinomadura sp. WMMB 499]
MPVEIDITQRLATIADATLDIVASDGLDGVSIRAVAKRIGGSTTLVTNYLRTREALLVNAIEHATRAWAAELEESVAGAGDRDRLLAAVRWAGSTGGNDEVLRRLFMELLGRGGPESAAVRTLREDARENRAELVDAARDAGAGDSEFTADVLFLVLRGFYVSSLEDPERWNDASMTPLLERLVRLLTTTT